MNRPLVLVLIGVTLAASQCWYADLTDTDSAKKLDDADKKKCQEKVGRSKENCEIRVKCNEGTDRSPGYYFDSDYYGDGYMLKCRNQNWQASDGGSLPICKRGCTALDNIFMANATYHNTPPARTYQNGANKLWPIGTVIETQCKAGYYFQVSATHQAKGYDEHKCTGGVASGWEDLNRDPKETGYAWPAYCRGYCDKINNNTLPSGVEIVQDPTTTLANPPQNNGKTVLPVGAQYVLRCKDGYKPTDPRYKDGRQQLSCDGNWRDTITGKQPADILQCTAQGCPPITSTNLPMNGVTEEGSGCAGDAKMDGCRVTIKCAKSDGTGSSVGFYMPGKPIGYQLTCYKGTWYDENNATAQTDGQGKYPGTCEPGCVGLSRTEQIFTTIINAPSNTGNKNDDITVYPIGTQITTTCNDGYVRPGMKIQGEVAFVCERLTGWKITIDALAGNKVYPGTCVPACEVTADSVGTNKEVIGEQYTKNGTQWVQKGATMTRRCLPDYVPTNSESSPQTLVCEGGNSAWKDPVTNKTNQGPLQCIAEGAPGCTEVPVGSGVNVTYTGNCTKVDGLLPKECIVSIRCRDGYYPDGAFTVTETGWQNLSCKAGKDGYIDLVTNQSNATMLKCIQACEYPDSFVAAAYTPPPPASGDIFPSTYAGKRYLKPGATVTTTCKNITDGYYWNNEVDKNRVEVDHLITFVHKCKGGDMKYEKESGMQINGVMPGDMCGPTCPSLSPSATTAVANTGKLNSIEFWTLSKKYVVSVEYKATCKAGFEYPSGSPESVRGFQRLLCVGGTQVYQDLDTLAYNAAVTQCIKAPEPRCPAIDQANQKVDFDAESGDCTLQSGTVPVDCVITVKCKEGHFPDKIYTGISATSKLQCKKLANNTAIWVDVGSNSVVPPLVCVPGCPIYPLNGSAQIVQDAPRVTVAGVTYYPTQSDVTVACNPGYVASGFYTPDTTGLAFRCLATDAAKPWMNKKSNQLERGPFLVCVKYCPALDLNEFEGVSAERGPSEKVWETGLVVFADGTYDLKCNPGYTYRPTRPNGFQTVVCDGATGQYLEINNGGANVSNAAIQPCFRIDGNGCGAPPLQSNSRVLNKNSCDAGSTPYPKGCAITVACNDGFAPIDSQYNGTGQQQINCQDGYDWYDSFGNKVTQTIMCTPVCKVEVASQVANIKNTTSITIVMGGVTYIPAGGYLVVQCVGDGVIWRDDTSQTKTEIRYKCIGGSTNNWQVVGGSSTSTIPGDGCISTCLPMTVPPEVSITWQSPVGITYNGQQLIANGDKYAFSCAVGYKRPDGQPATEEAMCNGATRKYVNPATNADFNAPRQCQKIVTGCKQLTFDPTLISETIQGCSKPEGFFNEECKLGYRCQRGYKPDITDYNTVDGYRNLTCRLTRGQYNWVDSKGVQVIVGPPLNCIPGCNNDTSSGTKPNFATLVYQSDWSYMDYTIPNQPTSKTVPAVVASCFKADEYNGSAYQSEYYSCPVTPSYYNNFCSGACRQLQQPYPVGVKTLGANGLILATGLDYIFGWTFYHFVCETGYSYAEEPYKTRGYQRIMCDNATSTYTDLTADKKNSTYIAPCVLNQGCQEMQKGASVSGPSDQTGCARPTPATFSENCKLKYSCETGSYPSDPAYLYFGSQPLICQPGSNVWNVTDGPKKGQAVSQILQCVTGCSEITLPIVTEILKTVSVTVTNSSYPPTNSGQYSETLTCVSTNTRTEIQNALNNMTITSGQFFCSSAKNPQNQLKIDDKALCSSTCPSLTTTPTTGLIITVPALYNPFGTGSLIKSGSSYSFSCEPGYDLTYPPGATTTTPVQFTCLPEGNIRNLANNQPFNPSSPPQCVQKPQCNKPTTNNVDVAYDQDTCGQNTDSAAISGCKMSAKCKNGTYPSNPDLQSQPAFNYQCSSNGNQPLAWRNVSNPSQTYDVNCVEGCLTVSSDFTDALILSIRGTDKILKCINAVPPPEGTKQYYCAGEASGINGIANYKCTGMCLLPPLASGITVTQPDLLAPILVTQFQSQTQERNWAPIPVVIIPGTTSTFTCPAGQMFTGLGTNTRRLTCGSGSEQTVTRDAGGQVVYEVGTCS